MIDAVIGGDVAITKMVPGESVGGGTLDCWLTLEFKDLPEGIDCGARVYEASRLAPTAGIDSWQNERAAG
jgi:hypothetical protein